MTIDPNSLVPPPDDRSETGTNRELEEISSGGSEVPDESPHTGTNTELEEAVEQQKR